MQAQIKSDTGEILAVGEFPTAPPDGITIVDLTVEQLEQITNLCGDKYYTDGVITAPDNDAICAQRIADKAAVELERTHEAALRVKLENALASLQAYRGLATPTGAQTTAVVKLLSSCVVWLIRLQLRKLDADD